MFLLSGYLSQTYCVYFIVTALSIRNWCVNVYNSFNGITTNTINYSTGSELLSLDNRYRSTSAWNTQLSLLSNKVRFPLAYLTTALYLHYLALTDQNSWSKLCKRNLCCNGGLNVHSRKRDRGFESSQLPLFFTRAILCYSATNDPYRLSFI